MACCLDSFESMNFGSSTNFIVLSHTYTTVEARGYIRQGKSTGTRKTSDTTSTSHLTSEVATGDHYLNRFDEVFLKSFIIRPPGTLQAWVPAENGT